MDKAPRTATECYVRPCKPTQPCRPTCPGAADVVVDGEPQAWVVSRTVNCEDYYRALQASVGQVLDATLSGSANIERQASSHAFLSELDAWHAVLSNRPEALVIRRASIEYQFGLLLLAAGHYRYAFAGLRATLELALTAIDHSAHVLHHRNWLRGARDISWAALVDEDTSPLSKAFCDAFFFELREEIPRMNAIAKSSYRKCSEHVHGNPANTLRLPEILAYSEEAFLAWHDVAESVRYVLQFCHAMRYLAELQLSELATIERYVTENLGHLEPIRFFLAKSRT